MKLAIVGTGYVGLVTGAGFAAHGHDVTCVDIDAARVASLQRGQIPFHEPGLAELVRRTARLGFTTSLPDAVRGADIVLIAVGTPCAADGAPDLRDVFRAAESIGDAIDPGGIVVTKSTVPVGTSERVGDLVSRRAGRAVAVVSNPEFLQEGTAVADFFAPARVVVGGHDARALARVAELYRGLVRPDALHVMDLRSAELTKYAANAMLATRVAFMNELALLCDAVGADVDAIRQGIASDPRIGASFLLAGAGIGGSCLPKDLRGLRETGLQAGAPMRIATAVCDANDRHKRVLGERLIARFGGALHGRRIAIWGLAFKPGTDDIREAPALGLVEQILAAGGVAVAHDPEAMAAVRARLGDTLELAGDPYAAARGADAIVLVTEWPALLRPDWHRLRDLVRTPLAIDGRNAWCAADARDAGFAYEGIGRGTRDVLAAARRAA